MEEREGAQLHYCGRYRRGEQHKAIYFRPSDFILDKGFTNYSPNGISGAFSLHNVRLVHKNHQFFHGGSWEVTLGCGTKRFYYPRPGSSQEFDLVEEIRPNGNRVFYEYDKERKLSRVYLTANQNKTPLLEYTVAYQGHDIITKGSNGKTVCYTLDRNRCEGVNLSAGYRWISRHLRLTAVEGDHITKTSYAYPSQAGDDDLLGKVVQVTHPEGRELRIDYHKGSVRVKSLSGPVGTDQKLYPFATFEYPQNGMCDIRGLCGEHTRVVFNTGTNRISHKQLWSQGTLQSQVQYYWTTNGPKSGNLEAKALCDASGAAQSSTRLFYDDEGNVTKEIIYGNLSGLGPSTHALNSIGEPQCPVDGYVIERTYHPVFKTILTEKRGEDGLFTEYRYHAGTNLLRQKLVGGDIRVSREFFDYDSYANLIKHIVDNGTGHVDRLDNVTVRTITEIEPIVTPLSPAFGKPAKKMEKYWEAGEERLLHTVHYHYNELGYPIQEDIYDAHGEHRYSLYRSYDAAGRVLEETNPIGQKTSHVYDANGNKILTTFIDQNIHIEYLYDLSNRLIKETEVHPHARYETTHQYDLSSRKIATIDPFGNETLYTYNELDQLVAITHPKVNDRRGVERFAYDIAGNRITSQDVLGHTTQTSYTSRGQPVLITYPDGSQERFQYNGDGSLAKHTATNGVTEGVYYDRYLRPITKAFFDEEGNHLYSTHATYHGSQMITETDGNGIETRYGYDGAGRLIETCKGSKRIQYTYDSLGRQDTTIEWIDDTTARVTTREYDLLNREIEERVQDLAGTLYSRQQYAYDSYGNRCLHRTETSQGIAETKTTYDSRNRPIRLEDALGHVTITEYKENFTTGFTTTTITDPLSNQTIVKQNSIGQRVEETRKDAQGKVCAHSIYFYDLAGRKIRQNDTAIAHGFPNRIIVTEWAYDSMGRVITLTEAVNTPEAKCTRYTYNQKGQKEIICLPDGTLLHHLYDDLGRLQRYYASDRSFDYTYTYDLNNNVLSVIDTLTQTLTQRKYDTNNRITLEILANDLVLSYTRDRLGRLTCILLPDQTSIAYAYNAVHLTSVSRLSQTPYEHHYTLYDLSGTLLEELSPAGEITYTWDLLKRPCSLHSTHFRETIPVEGYDAVGNLLQKIRQDSEQTVCCQYTYDALYQLRTETVTGFDDRSYLYDSLYNRRLRNSQEHIHNHLNQLLSVGETTYTYDQRGNLITEETPASHVQYRYDALGRLTTLVRNGQETHYQYDSFNRRLKKSSDQGEERYLYVDQNEIGQIDPYGKIVQLRVLGQGKGAEIGSAIALELDGKTYIPIHDHSGHVSVLVDPENQTLAEGYTYTAFGEELRYGPGTTNPWHFSSKRYDPESGWIYFGRRYYDPVTGRWTTPDPIGFTDGPNLYAYVKNNPLTHFDLYGLLLCTDFHSPDTLCSRRPISSPLNSTRVFGALQAFGGLTEAGLGGGLSMASQGILVPLGMAMIAHGADHYTAGMSALFSGKPQSTLSAQGLQKCGLSAGRSHAVDNTLSMVATLGANTYMQTLRQSAPLLGNTSALTHQTAKLSPVVEEVKAAKFYKSGPSILKRESSLQRTQPNGNFYSVAFETKLSPTAYPGFSRARHFQEANESLLNSMERNAQFSEMMEELGINLERTITGLAPRTSPANWTWHHSQSNGVMQLVPRTQHTPGSIFWNTLHPGGRGGYSLWGQ